MKEVQDNFSDSAAIYATFRPSPPQALYDFLYSQVNNFGTAWDCGTGNGQVAVALSERFKTVYATDISEKQVAKAPQKDNIIYKIERSEHSTLPNNSVDLVTVAQAVHWFDFDAFNAEVKRVGRHGAIIAIWTYILLRVTPEIDKVVDDLFHNITKPYWDKEREYVDARYSTIPFPYEEIATPVFEILPEWNFEQLTGYLRTWSGVQHYMKQTGKDPVAQVTPALKDAWGDATTRQIKFPLYMRMGKIK